MQLTWILLKNINNNCDIIEKTELCVCVFTYYRMLLRDFTERRMKIRASTKAPLLSFATSITTIVGRCKNRDGIRAKRGMMPSHSHAKPWIKPTGMLTSILSATYC